MPSPTTCRFLDAKVRTLSARARRLSELTPTAVGFRREDRPYVPSPAHFRAANERLMEIDKAIRFRLDFLRRHWRNAPPRLALLYLALVEREVDRARRAFGMFFEIFSQRGTAFGPVLAAHDIIAADCYQAVRHSAPLTFPGPVLKPLTYLEHGYSPATMRRGVALSRLLGEKNPFPLIRIPWDRDNPWQSVFLHEISHNLQADLRLWQENKDALTARLLKNMGDPTVTSIYGRWHKEIFADLTALLLGGPASVWGMMDFLAHPPPKVLTYKPRGAHPTGYLRVLILAEMLARMGFDEEAGRVRKVWKELYQPARGHRLPARLLTTASRVIPMVVDEIAYQPRRNLAQRALVDVIQFGKDDEARIRQVSRYLTRGIVPPDVPPRFLVSASRKALIHGAPLANLSALVIEHLSTLAAKQRTVPEFPTVAAA